MTKQQDKMMICRMGHTLTEGIEFCRDEDCRHYKCDASKCPPEDRNCVFCISYEPEPPCDTCVRDKCTVKQFDVKPVACGEYLQKPEPQPATCPDCGQPNYEYNQKHICPADLQPKHCTEPQEEFEEAIASSLSHEKGMAELELLNNNCQPTQMPLREQCNHAGVCKYDDALCPAECGYFEPVIDPEAHDSAVAKQAVKEFANKCLDVMTVKAHDAYDRRSCYIESLEAVLAHIRAMAEGKE